MPFRNPDLPVDERIDDLLGRLTLEEKVSLMHQWQPAIPRLDIPAFRTGTEALHGVAWLGEATVFPQAIGLGSTWNPELLEDVGSVVGTEARGFNAIDPDYHGLNLWAPVVDPLRDPRAGRNEEGYSEDALLTGVMSTAYAQGMRGDHPDYLKSSPMLKHFIGYNNEVDRSTTNSSMPARMLQEYYLEFFRPAIESGAVSGIMASYNFANGRPAHLSPLIEDEVRSWNDVFVVSDAYAPTNVTGSQNYYDTPAKSHAALVKAGIDSFTDRGEDSSFTTASITAALDAGLLTESDLDRSLRNMLRVRFRLGDFDPPGLNPYEDIGPEVINAPEHQQLAREAATEQTVLLKNEGDALPLDEDGAGDVAVIGPLGDTLYEDWYSGTMPYKVTPLDGLRERLGADRVSAHEGVDEIALRVAETGDYVTAPTDESGGQLTTSGSGVGTAETMSLFDWGQGVYALRTEANGKYVSRGWDDVLRNDQVQPNGWQVRETFTFTDAEDGTVLVRNVQSGNYLTVGADGGLTTGTADAAEATRFVRETVSSGIDEAVATAEAADTVVMVVGNNPYINGRETDDREDIRLPAAQRELIRAVTRANPDTTLVVESSYPLAINWADENVPSILWTSHAGQETGHALADVLLGDVSPAGRLPQTWYRSVDELPSILEYDIARGDTTYLYYDGDPLYAFGHGLTYTDFTYSQPRVSSSTLDPDGTAEVSVDVTNTGDVDSDEVVQLYSRALDSPVEQPNRELRAFERVHVPAGATHTVTFDVSGADLRHWDVVSDRLVPTAGRHELLVGSASDDIRGTASVRVPGSVQQPTRHLAREAENVADFDDYQGVEIVDRSKTAGDSVGAHAGDWVAFEQVALSRSIRELRLEVAREASGTARVQVRLGSADGRLLGSADVASTGDRYAYETVPVPLDEVPGGRHDLVLVFGGEMRASTVRLSR
ncbi:exo-1,4-beta-glucosidase [Haloactinopolyspora alba]|uniref:Exo-alpha-(1->6)-L-arabinopyranosidase n=2 Tax=Haloactinopolyspora alba TaxID=648780 RepID=A0A2P8E6Y4_9ACTN|nr:exo-1,4-beta-glucosidase [Haloactinopolyspora alba]